MWKRQRKAYQKEGATIITAVFTENQTWIWDLIQDWDQDKDLLIQNQDQDSEVPRPRPSLRGSRPRPRLRRDELCTQRATHQKHDTINTILNNKRPDHVSDKKPLRAPNYFCNPRSPLRCRSATYCSTLCFTPSLFCNSRSPLRSATPDFWLATLRAPLWQ